MSIATLWDLTGPWYRDRLDPTAARPEVDTLDGWLAAAGLDGDFWRLGPKRQ